MATPPVAYHFVSRWHLAAPVAAVWSALASPAAWADWWPGLEQSRHLPKLSSGLGDRADFVWRAPLGYRLRLSTTITKINTPNLLGFAATGDLVGTGRCDITPGQTAMVTIRWDVATTKPWMNRFAWLLRPAFIYSHLRLMAAGERGLRAYLANRA